MQERIYKPFSPAYKPIEAYGLVLQTELSDPTVLSALNKADKDYLHWEDLRYKSWLPQKFSANKEAFWMLLLFKRYCDAIPTPIKDSSGNFFRVNTKNYSEFLHILDKEMAGNFIGITNLSEMNKKQFITRNIIEESIASSQLEGANTSRTIAKKMLLEGRRPSNHSEQMIVNNHQVMMSIEQEFYKKDLSLELMCELHSIITHKTLDESRQGKLRETLDEHGERLKIIPWENTIAYIAPDKEFVEKELLRLIDFANDKVIKGSDFIHPFIKGIMLHFWMGLLHPFEDGNGRLARILFYWYMLKHEYWIFKYLSLSEKIKKSWKQYAMAYIYSEQEPYDLTYFVHYNIQKLEMARKDFQEYVRNQVNENRLITSSRQEEYQFNDRQIKLLHYFSQEMEGRINLMAYQRLYIVKKLTAIKDLNELVNKGFLVKKKIGRNTYYYPTKWVNKLLGRGLAKS